MKVLLIGEYSGFYTNLKLGLQELGVEVVHASNGDGWKQIEGADMELFHICSEDNKLKKFNDRIISPIINVNKFYDYDVVQLIHEDVFNPYVNSHMIKCIKKNNSKMFVNICGNTETLFKSWKSGKLDYYTYDDNKEKYKKYVSMAPANIMERRTERFVDKIADGIIPTAYEYALGVRNYNNYLKTIQLPFDASKVEYNENKVDGKLIFYHGISREKDKGTNFIREAFKIIKDRYPNDVETILSERMPLDQYLDVLKRTNVLVDACKEHFWGLNACYGMAQGKVVMSGASSNSLHEYGIEKCPVVHIEPNVQQIVGQMEYIIQNKDRMTIWGYESRKFVETFHNHIEVAKQYIHCWNEKGKKNYE